MLVVGLEFGGGRMVDRSGIAWFRACAGSKSKALTLLLHPRGLNPKP